MTQDERIEATLAASRAKIRTGKSAKIAKTKKDPRWVGRFFRTLDNMRNKWAY